MAHLEATHQAHLGVLGEDYAAPMQRGARLGELAEANPYSTLKSGRGVSNPLWDVADRDIRPGSARESATVPRRSSARSKPGGRPSVRELPDELGGGPLRLPASVALTDAHRTGADRFPKSPMSAGSTVRGRLETASGNAGRAIEQSLQWSSRGGVVSTKVHSSYLHSGREAVS